MPYVSKNQHEILDQLFDFIQKYMVEHGYSPSFDEIAENCHLSRSSVVHYLSRLEIQGRIRREFGKARSIVIMKND